MRTLLFLSLSLSLIACGDDDSRPTDSGAGGVDTGTPIVPDGGGTDTGTPVPDGGGGGTDSGTMTGMCPMGTCNLISNAGCDSAMGQGCYWGGREMGPVCAPAGTAAQGAECDSVNDCQEGMTCDEGTCRKICCGASDASCDPGDFCIGFADDMGNLGFGACRTPSGCNALTQMGCPSGQGCYPIGADGTTDCATPAMGAGTMQGASCSFANGCTAGLFCLGPAGSGQCSRACNPMDDDCGDGLVCGRVSDTLGGCVPRPAM